MSAFMKRFAVPVVVGGALVLAVSAWVLIPRNDLPAPDAPATETAAPSTPVSPLLEGQETQGACGFLFQAATSTDDIFRASVFAVKVKIAESPGSYSEPFRDIVQRLSETVVYGNDPGAGADLREYCTHNSY